MKSLFSLLLLTFFSMTSLLAQKSNDRVYELRIYHCHDGRRNVLVDRFRDHTIGIFENYGMENVAYWLPTSEDMKNDLIYILSYPSMEARNASWDGFMADPDWQKAWADSKKDGPVVATVDARFLKLEPELTKKLKSKVHSPEKIFELRSYYCHPGRFPNIVARFRDHTRAIFEDHGMENVAYWGSIEEEDKQSHLVYILAHDSEDAAKNSWDSFRVDPKWKTAQAASEEDGKIVEKVVSIMMEPLPFSEIR